MKTRVRFGWKTVTESWWQTDVTLATARGEDLIYTSPRGDTAEECTEDTAAVMEELERDHASLSPGCKATATAPYLHVERYLRPVAA